MCRGGWTTQRTRWLIYAAIPVLLATTLVNMPPFTDCAPNPPASDGEYWFPPTRVVVQPWRGPHHVYGVFVVPERYKFDHLYKAKLIIQGLEEELSASSPEVGEADEMVAREQGQYANRVYVSTRTALWLLISGRFGNLRSSCHWWLVIADRGWKPTEAAKME